MVWNLRGSRPWNWGCNILLFALISAIQTRYDTRIMVHHGEDAQCVAVKVLVLDQQRNNISVNMWACAIRASTWTDDNILINKPWFRIQRWIPVYSFWVPTKNCECHKFTLLLSNISPRVAAGACGLLRLDGSFGQKWVDPYVPWLTLAKY